MTAQQVWNTVRSAPHVIAPALLALAIRGVHLGFLRARDPLFYSPVVDSWVHVRRAYQVLDLGILLPGIEAFYKGPLYSYVLALFFAIFGPRDGLFAAYLFSVACGTLSVALIAGLAARLGGKTAAWIAGLTAALYGPAVHFDTTLLLVPLVSVLLLAAADRLLRAQVAPKPGPMLVAAGVLLGLLSITRANGLLAVAAVALLAALLARSGTLRVAPLRAAALVLVPAVIVVAPITARNALLEDDPVLISWNGGINLFMGNDPAFDQTSGNWHPDATWSRLYNAPFESGLSGGADHQRFFIRQSVSRFLDDPVTGLAILARKTALLFTAYEIQNNRRIDPVRERSPVLRWLMPRAGPWIFPFVLVAPLIGFGLALLERKKLLEATPLLVLAAVWAISPILFFHTARFRLSAILLLLPVAAAALSSPNLRAPHRVALAAALGLAVLAIAVATVPGSPTLPPSDEINLADVAEREDRPDDALAWLVRAVEAEPDDPFARMRLANRLWQSRRSADALEHYRALLEQEGLAADWKIGATRGVARCMWARRRDEEWRAWFGRYLDAEPDRPRTGERPDFHLRDMPPLRGCLGRIEFAEGLAQNNDRDAARAEIDRVSADCGGVEPIATRARRIQSMLR